MEEEEGDDIDVYNQKCLTTLKEWSKDGKYSRMEEEVEDGAQ